MTTCTVDGCEQTAHARGWCNLHYLRWRTSGHPGEAVTRRPPRNAVCDVEFCSLPHYGQGLCKGHYDRHLRGAPIDVPVLPYGHARDYFEATVMLPSDGCREWPYARSGVGYGHLHVPGRGRVGVHVLVCERWQGPMPEPGMHAAHDPGCSSRSCWAGEHLRWATPAENERDKSRVHRCLTL